uniref:Disease resistance protein RPM1 n=1 Tax=Oryza rufipogon TaxID=4529 RepID=A0A0E0PWI4_ORYRU
MHDPVQYCLHAESATNLTTHLIGLVNEKSRYFIVAHGFVDRIGILDWSVFGEGEESIQSMAETVLSMARSLVGSAISKATSAAAHEASLLLGVQKDIWYIKYELKTMQAFLRAAEVWAEQIRDLSYDIEDCLDEFKVHIESQNLFYQMVKLRKRHLIATQIRNLKSRVEEVSSRNSRYNLVKPISSSNEDDMDCYAEDIRNQSTSNVDETELVGFSDSKIRLLELISANVNNGPTKVICVVGMGGLGKTALSRKIFESKEDIGKNFPCNAWITVSQSFNRIELLKDMIRQFLGSNSLDQVLQELQGKMVVQIPHLSDYLRKKLKEKRYFVVLDDLWSLDAWNWINDIAFPKNNNKGSRIVVTTRDVGLAEKCTTTSLVYHLEHLQMNDAITLLLRKTNRTHEDMGTNKNMQKIVEQIVNKCGRLPLAILTIGAVLATKQVLEWEKFYKQLPSELESNPSLQALRRMVTLGYNHLPSHLKSCFLYLSIFPEDFEIKRSRLVDRWIAEGFVRAKVGMTTKDVGDSYFNELINRSMIQRSRVGIEGKIKSCRVRDIMRDITVSISREENFVFLPVHDGSNLAQENTHHIALHGSMSCKTGLDWSIIRSLAIFGDRPNNLAHTICSNKFRMLRVLDLEDVKFLITQKDFNNIALLRHLKYLSFGRIFSSCIYTLPRSIGKLHGLQTLNMSSTYIATLPTEISKLQCLRTLRCTRVSNNNNFSINHPVKCLTNTMCLPNIFTPSVSSDNRAKQIAELHMATKSCWSESYSVKVPKGIGKLGELQILEHVDIRRTSTSAIQELAQLSKLTKLSVTTKGSTEEKCKILYRAIQRLCSLQSLRVDAEGSSGNGTLKCLDSISYPPLLLKTLKLYGDLEEMPNWIEQLSHLMKFYLLGSKLKEGKTMLILGALPNLMLLCLSLDAYLGENLVFRTGAFQKLRTLWFDKLDQLREIRFENDSSPLLEKIGIRYCRLEIGIIGISNLMRLKEITLGYRVKVGYLGQLEREVGTHPNRPVLRMEEDRSCHDLRRDGKGSAKWTQRSPSLSPRARTHRTDLVVMAETVLSMARSLVGNAITKAGEAAAAEISLLIAEEMEKKPRLLKAWVEQVRDLSFDIEDCLAEFMVHVGSKSLSQQLMKLKHRHRIAIQIRDLKSRVEEVSDRNSRYSLISPNTDEHDTLRDEFRYWSAKNIDEAELVGFDDAKESILNLIDVHANHGLAKVIFVVGMGGLGKTSLVKKSFVRTELLRGLIKQLLGGDSENEHFKGLQSMQRNEKVEDLVEDLKQGLKEKSGDKSSEVVAEFRKEVTERNVNYLCEALQKLSSLCSLRVEAKPFRGLHMLEQLASPPPFLHTLKLKGSLHEIPSWVGKLEKLVKVQLVFTKLKDTESIQVLGELPGLKCLRLILNAYIGKELVLCHGKFRGLKTLRLDSLEELRKVTFEERTSPKLETITIQDCSSELAVCGTANLQSLEKIKYFAKGKLVKRPVVQAGQSQSAHHREDIKAAEIIEKSQTSSLEKGESSQSIPRPDVLRTLPPISATTKLKRSLSCPASTSIRKVEPPMFANRIVNVGGENFSRDNHGTERCAAASRPRAELSWLEPLRRLCVAPLLTRGGRKKKGERKERDEERWRADILKNHKYNARRNHSAWPGPSCSCDDDEDLRRRLGIKPRPAKRMPICYDDDDDDSRKRKDAEAVASRLGPPSNTCCAHRPAFLCFTTVCAQIPGCAQQHSYNIHLKEEKEYKMTDTVLSIAKSLVGSAVSKVASVAAEKMVLLLGQVRDLSYDIEDCLDEFTVHVGSQNLSRQLMKLKDRHRIAIQIRNLRTRIEEVSTRNIRYNLIENDLTCTTTDERNLFMEDIHNQSANNIEEADLVGFSGPKRELLDLIDVHANIGPTKVVCVVGMGGLGKTTIARKIYESKEDIAKNFSCCAWITVSQSFVRLELLKDLMMKLFGEEVLKKQMRELEGKVPQVDDLASYLRTELNERRYFVVLDDKWINSIAFPRNNNKGSWVIVTTRDVGLAKECTSELLIYQLKPLEISYAKELLLRKANKTTEDIESDKKMSDIITKIVKKCGYLPLAILTIGGVLATKEIREWETFYSQIPSELESNPNLEAMRRIVTLSYNYLPSHLKQCFLYLSIFPEDFEINRNCLVNRWMAEGFIKARANMTIEDVGKSYFKELINRSMIQPSRAGVRGEF